MAISEHELWVLSFYRTSEIVGSLFFGRLARSLSPGQIQIDMTKHFADEALHAHYWTQCIESLGAEPVKTKQAYQDQYLEAAGMPANLMEVLAITHIFEQRVIKQYATHSKELALRPEVKETLYKIMDDEKWHIQWVREALAGMEQKYGKEMIDDTIGRFREADAQVYEKTLQELTDRFAILKAEMRVVA